MIEFVRDRILLLNRTVYSPGQDLSLPVTSGRHLIQSDFDLIIQATFLS